LDRRVEASEVAAAASGEDPAAGGQAMPRLIAPRGTLAALDLLARLARTLSSSGVVGSSSSALRPAASAYPAPQRGRYCYGCGRGGSIDDLAAALWDLDTRGPDFLGLRWRLGG